MLTIGIGHRKDSDQVGDISVGFVLHLRFNNISSFPITILVVSGAAILKKTRDIGEQDNRPFSGPQLSDAGLFGDDVVKESPEDIPKTNESVMDTREIESDSDT